MAHTVASRPHHAAVVETALGQQDDLAVIGTWLDARASRSPHTRTAYQKEARRFVLYMHHEQQLEHLHQVKVEHLHAYYAHLANPPAHWVIHRATPKHFRPLTMCLYGALSAQSIAYTRMVIQSLYRYLQDAGHLTRNPVALSARPVVPTLNMADKALEPDAWLFFWQWLCEQEHQATTTEMQRLAVRRRWMCALLYHTGLRRSSIAEGNMSGFYRRDGAWWLTVPVKGGRLHTVPVQQTLLDELKRYRLAFGLLPLPYPQENQPLISDVRDLGQPILARNIGAEFEKLRHRAAAACEDPFLAQQIRHLTAHGLRHTHATHSLIAGARLEAVQSALAHRDISTTSIYAKATQAMRVEHATQFEQFWQDLYAED